MNIHRKNIKNGVDFECRNAECWILIVQKLNFWALIVEQSAVKYWTVSGWLLNSHEKLFEETNRKKPKNTHKLLTANNLHQPRKNSYFLRPKSFFLRKMPEIGKINTFFQQDEVDYSALSPHSPSAISSRAKKIYVQITICASENNKNVTVDLAGQMIIRIFARKKKYHWRKWF